jgi:hypothetical protein
MRSSSFRVKERKPSFPLPDYFLFCPESAEIFDIFVSYFKNFTISAPYQTQSSLQVSLIQPS